MDSRCVIFDVGGVLKITPATGWEGRWERQLGLPPAALNQRLEDVWLAASVGTISEQEMRARVAAALGLDAVQTDGLMSDLWADYLGVANEELLAYVRTLRFRCALGVLSNSFVGAREREEQLYRLGELVDAVVYSHEIGMCKPDLRVYELACRRLKVQPKECLFIDDMAENVEGALAVGMQGLLFENNARTVARIAHHLGVGSAVGGG
ncbi:HAD family hydrolase [Actinacidiphila soli]|uniref:HAD family hydrolase n=1 Tax=Actinacidiphila soli TaxID=2487275 RepID=UPI000FCA932A|nr:HAD family phosphatase [Actinacidiphila soli]